MRNASLTSSISSILRHSEIEASGAKSLSVAGRAALLACDSAGRLIGRRSSAWHPANTPHPRPILRRTIDILRKRGLVYVKQIGGTREARLTKVGKWYARTLCGALADDCFSTEKGSRA